MKKILILFLLIISAGTVLAGKVDWKEYSYTKFIVQTKSELGISEATGQISIKTNLATLDEKNLKYRVIKIKKLFKDRNSDLQLYRDLGLGKIYVFYIQWNQQVDMTQLIDDYISDTNIVYSEPVFIGHSAGQRDFNSVFTTGTKPALMPNDPQFFMQWYLNNTGIISTTSGASAKIGADINMLNAWELDTGSDNIVVAILDSGIKDDHPELRGRIWTNKKEIPNNGIDDDNNGYVDDVRGWNFTEDNNNPHDGFGHGTNIASVIGENSNNGVAFAGINFACKLMNCKNLTDDNRGDYDWWIESIQYAADNGARIINMSEGGEDYSKTLKKAIDYALAKGVFIVTAMMNKGDGKSYYPASLPGVFAVGATDTDDRRCKKFTWGGGSCWGKHIKVVAPGNKIYGLDNNDDFKYDVSWSGTSQATAIVSGIASLLLSQNPDRTKEDLNNILISTAKDRVGDPREDTPGWDQYMGFGRVDAYTALMYEYNGYNVDKDKVRVKRDTSNKEDPAGKESSDLEKKRKEAKAAEEKPGQ
jgi:subtilisin family serine protease